MKIHVDVDKPICWPSLWPWLLARTCAINMFCTGRRAIKMSVHHGFFSFQKGAGEEIQHLHAGWPLCYHTCSYLFSPVFWSAPPKNHLALRTRAVHDICSMGGNMPSSASGAILHGGVFVLLYKQSQLCLTKIMEVSVSMQQSSCSV